MKILVTGSAGFIGHFVAKRLAEANHKVIGVDNLNDYYDVNLKLARLHQAGFEREDVIKGEAESLIYSNYKFLLNDISDGFATSKIFRENKFDLVCHLAAQAGVRYSIENPDSYIQSNLVGFFNILEGCRHTKVKHLVYASSSSVYGMNNKIPFSTDDSVDKPVSLYAATKKSNELMAHSYSHLYRFHTTALRFFTVYGPWGRPDMAPMLFLDAASNGESIKIFNNGDMIRDFTYIDDIVDGVFEVLLADKISNEKELYNVFNIGGSQPIKLLDFVGELERSLGVDIKKVMLPMQAGDVRQTYADMSGFESSFGWKPSVSIQEGVKEFVDWYKSFYLK